MEIENLLLIKNNIRDSMMQNINIFFLHDPNYEKEDSIDIELYFIKQKNDNVIKMKLLFTDVKEFNFTYSVTFPHSYIDLLSLFFLEENNQIYFSLDPYDERKGIDERDNEIIIAKEVKYYLLK